MTERKKIPIVRITVKPDFYFYTDVLLKDFDNTKVPEAKRDAAKQIEEGIPKGKAVVRHTKEIVWVYEDEHPKY